MPIPGWRGGNHDAWRYGKNGLKIFVIEIRPYGEGAA
jgi:hypothetical protein